jgi:hypothetical protein
MASTRFTVQATWNLLEQSVAPALNEAHEAVGRDRERSVGEWPAHDA